jgi:hypothetical protein
VSITAKGFVPREVEDVMGDTARVSIFESAVPGVAPVVSLVSQEGDPDEVEASVLHLDAPAARALAAHLVQAAEAVEAAQ